MVLCPLRVKIPFPLFSPHSAMEGGLQAKNKQMAIYEILKGRIYCDKCKKFIGEIRYAKPEHERLFSAEILCVSCGASDMKEEKEITN